MKNIIFSLFTSTVLLTNCGGNGTSSEEKPKTPEELKMELLSQERQTPLNYLSAECQLRQDQKQTRAAGLFHGAEYESDGATIYGTVSNSATLADYKDVVVTVTFLSKTDSPIESKDYTIYEFFKAKSKTQFEFKAYPPEEMTNFQIEIKGATATN